MDASTLRAILIVAGSFMIFGGVFNISWIMNSRRGQGCARLIGRGMVRVLYILMGIASIVLAFTVR
ncbi:MAG: hypothetical protein MUF87_09595 [Anaerolineae bacterium]|nr:hypothetical protein [Anaerolineae bacterium]